MNPKDRVNVTTRRALIQQLVLIGAAAPLLARAGGKVAPARIPKIGFLTGYDPPHINGFLDELRAQGFIDGQNIVIEKRYQHVDTNVRAMIKELAAMDLDFIVVAALTFALGVRRENPNMPMVIGTCPGMVSNGFARSLEHPGGIYTGMDELPGRVTVKRLELLKTAVPTAKRIALLSTTPGVGGHEAQLDDAQSTARELGVTVKPYRATTPAEVRSALAAIAADRMDAMLNFQGGLSLYCLEDIVAFAAEHRIPALYQATMFAERGGLMAWAPDLIEQFRVAARLAAQILRGAKPGDLPVKHPEKYFLTINAGAAKKLGLTLPPELLAQASRVVEENS